MPARCFVAADLTSAQRASLGIAAGALRELAPAWRSEKWVAPELLHVTVAFLGAIADPVEDEVLARLASAAAAFGPLELRLSGLRAVPGGRRTQMVWAVFEELSGQAEALRDSILAAGGCEPDPRPFRAHVTLVRARSPRSVHPSALEAASCAALEAGKDAVRSVSVPSLTVYASTLGPGGPTYRRLADLLLSGEGRTCV